MPFDLAMVRLSCLFQKSGEPSRTRTCDPLVKSQLLYRLSYRPTSRKSGVRCPQSKVSGCRFQVSGSQQIEVSSGSGSDRVLFTAQITRSHPLPHAGCPRGDPVATAPGTDYMACLNLKLTCQPAPDV